MAEAPRIALIHALRESMAPVANSLARLWPAAQAMNLLDDSLSADLARDGGLNAAMTERFLALSRYAAGTGAAAILFTCSAFGPCIEACASALAPLPVRKPNAAVIADCAAYGFAPRIGLLASFAPTLASMPAEIAAGLPAARVRTALAEGALAALAAGDAAAHDRLAAEAAMTLAGCDVIVLAQFSLARAAAAVAEATGRPVLTTPDSAVRALRAAVEG
jgi:hypothetical protein